MNFNDPAYLGCPGLSVRLRQPDHGLFDVPCFLQTNGEFSDFLWMLGSEILLFVRIGFKIEQLWIAVIRGMHKCVSICRAIIA